MPTVYRAHGLRFVVYLNDHEPAHVHAIAANGEARIELGTEDRGPQLVTVEGLSRAQARLALAEVVREQARMLAAWAQIHGGADR
jgi:hypothetical protein